MRRLTTKQYLKRATNKFGDMFDYSLVEYVNAHTKISIKCNKHNHLFSVRACRHLDSKTGRCPKCRAEIVSKAKLINQEDWIARAIKIHGNIYDYSRVKYLGNDIKVEIICQKHGPFWQIANNHLRGATCFKCSKEEFGQNQRLTTEEFIQKSISIHGDKYDYSKSIYTMANDKIEIICPEHGPFWQNAFSHYNEGCGCLECSFGNSSKVEKEWLDSLAIPKELRHTRIVFSDDTYIFTDAYDPETNTIYEFWGDYWHGNPEKFNLDDINKHTKRTFREHYEHTLNKTQKIKENGYNLIDIWENDWINES